MQDKLEPTLKEPNVNAAGDEENRGRFTPDGIYIGPVEIDADDVEYIMAELWRNKCALTGERLGTSMALIRWDRKRPAAPNNLVLMCTKAAKKFENDWDKLGDGRDGVEKEIRQKVESRLATCVLDAEDAY